MRSWCRWNLSFSYKSRLYTKQGTNGWIPVCREHNEINYSRWRRQCRRRTKQIPQKVTLEYHSNPKIMCCILLTSNAKTHYVKRSGFKIQGKKEIGNAKLRPISTFSLCVYYASAVRSKILRKNVFLISYGKLLMHMLWKPETRTFEEIFTFVSG